MLENCFDEMYGIGKGLRQPYEHFAQWLHETPAEIVKTRRAQADVLFRRMGITFAVYGDDEATERLIPFDMIPRIISADEWRFLEKGLVQRVQALNAFLSDIYGAQEILKAQILPKDIIFQNPGYCPAMQGFAVPHNLYVHIAGIDIVRTAEKEFYVLEDNARTPSGVSYMLENRDVMMRLVPELFKTQGIAPVEKYTDELASVLASLAPQNALSTPCAVVLTPGAYNSAYYEHSFLANSMGLELVEGVDLFVQDKVVYMRTTEGPKRVDVIYRRIDDDYLDPLCFRPDSTLGVPGLMSAYKAGNVTLTNGVGTGISDDKAIYSYMPEIIRFYTGENAILPNVPTWRCREKQALQYVLDNLKDLVVKAVDGSGGYGMLIGPAATAEELANFRAILEANPAKYIAQPTLALSTCPTWIGNDLAPRHIDLRPFVLTGAQGTRIVPGGLTRVAMRGGSLVVNSSQGGGTKDTWVLADDCYQTQRGG